MKLGREVLVIPAQLWLAGAEIAGDFVLRVWRRALRPALVALWRLLIAALAFAERHLTPARAVAAVALVAAGALIASQWLDYHSVSVGTDAYSGDVGVVAPAPEVETEIAGNAHAWVMVPLGLAAIAVLGFALTKRRRAAALLAPIGVLVIAIALIIDLPKGLDEGAAAIAYDGAKASLLEGFWLQIATGAVLIASGLMLPRYLRPRPAQARTETHRTEPGRRDRDPGQSRDQATAAAAAQGGRRPAQSGSAPGGVKSKTVISSEANRQTAATMHATGSSLVTSSDLPPARLWAAHVPGPLDAPLGSEAARAPARPGDQAPRAALARRRPRSSRGARSRPR